MTKNEIIKKIKETLGNANGNLAKYFYKNKKDLNIIIELTDFLPSETNLSNRFYYIRNDLNKIKCCLYCKKELLKNPKNTFCCCKCNVNYQIENTDIVERRSKTISINYHKKSNEEKQKIKEKRKQTNIKRYGVENNMHAPEIIEKKINTWIKNWGVDNPSKNFSIKEKRAKTNLKRYGNISPLHGREQIKKKKETWIKNLGVDNPAKSSLVQQKARNTYFDRTGYHHMMENPVVVKKIRKTFFENEGLGKHKQGYKYKKYKFPSGKEILIQGYEGGALDNVLLKLYNEKDIENNIKTINEFNFEYGKTTSGIKRKYIPDFYIKKDNLFIEIKSTYYYNKNIMGVYLKATSVIEKGYNFYALISNDNKKFNKLTYEEIKTDYEKGNTR